MSTFLFECILFEFKNTPSAIFEMFRSKEYLFCLFFNLFCLCFVLFCEMKNGRENCLLKCTSCETFDFASEKRVYLICILKSLSEMELPIRINF